MILIVASNPHLSRIWARHLERIGHETAMVQGQEDAISFLRLAPVDVIVLDLMLEEGSALAVADFLQLSLASGTGRLRDEQHIFLRRVDL